MKPIGRYGRPKASDRDYVNFLERRVGEVRRSPLPRTPVNMGFSLARIVD
jgi:hypothetical protein